MIRYIFTGLLYFVCFNSNANRYFVKEIAAVNAALNKCVKGDSVIIANGVYTDAVISFTNNGIILCAEVNGKVFFEGNSMLSFGGEKNVIEGFVWRNGGKGLGMQSVISYKNGNTNATRSIVKNCAIIGFNDADLNIDNKWVSIYGAYNTFTHCLLKDKFNLGATLVVWLPEQQPAHHTISYNYFLNRQNGPKSDNGLESMRIGDSKTSFTNAHCTVAFNRFEECDGEIEIISNKSCHNSYLQNTFVNSDGGLTLRHGNDCKVDGNVFDGQDKNLSYGVRIIGEGHLVSNNYFYRLAGSPNNVFRAPLTILNGLVNTPINGYFQVRRAEVTGNIFVDCAAPEIRVGAFSKREGMTVVPDTIAFTNNLFFATRPSTSANLYEQLSDAKHISMKGNIIYTNNLQADLAGFRLQQNDKITREGFTRIAGESGKLLLHAMKVHATTQNVTAGADWTDPSIEDKLSKQRFTYTSAGEVGPVWMR